MAKILVDGFNYQMLKNEGLDIQKIPRAQSSESVKPWSLWLDVGKTKVDSSALKAEISAVKVSGERMKQFSVELLPNQVGTYFQVFGSIPSLLSFYEELLESGLSAWEIPRLPTLNEVMVLLPTSEEEISHTPIKQTSLRALELLESLSKSGVPAITLDKHVSNSVTRNSLDQINDLYYGPLGDWLAWLSYCQFTFDELMNGTALTIIKKYHV